jgi:hypothetical protein
MRRLVEGVIMKIVRWLLRGIAALFVLILLLLGISFLVNRGLPSGSENPAELSSAEKARLSEFSHVRRELGNEVWPGWGTAEIPTVLYNESYAFLVGYSNPPDGWIKVPQNDRRGGPWTAVPDDTFNGQPYYRQPLPTSGETPQAFTVKIGDRWATSMTTMEWMEISLANQFREDMLPPFLVPIFPYPLVTRLFIRGSDGYISALAHESFHAYQGTVTEAHLAAAETGVSSAENNYPWAETEGAWQTELELLAGALRAETEAETADLARQFLAQRAQRRENATLTTTTTNYERQREWLEGLARYIELEIWRQASLVNYEPAAAIQDDPDFSDYDGFNNRWTQEIDQMGRMAADWGDGRFYYSGMAQAVLLDRLMPGWKDQALEDGVFLEDLLEAAVEG